MAKTVVTYSWLARKAMSLFKRDRNEYELLVTTDGSSKLIRGAKVQWKNHSSHVQDFRIIVGGRTWARLFGVRVGGKFYTQYETRFTATQYRKRLADKYMPFTLPDGARCYTNPSGGRTKCIYHNADGSVACEGYWQGGRRNRPGEADRPMLICDDTGEFVKEVMDDRMMNQYYPSLMYLGWFEEASRSRREWIESIRQMPHCDTNKVLEVAAKAYLAAARLCEKYPKMRLAMFPAAPYSEESGMRGHDCRHGDSVAVLARTANGVPTRWYLPEVIAYWEEDKVDEPAYAALSMVVPPHGCPLLDPTGRCGVLSKRVIPAAPLDYFSRVPVPQGYECAYHAVQAYDPSTPVDEREPFSPASPYYWAYGVGEDRNEHEKWMANWLKHRNKVAVQIVAPHLNEHEVSLPLPIRVPIAMKPEDVLLAFEEKMLLESLPLC